MRVLWVIKGLGPGGAERLLLAAAAAHDSKRFHIECAYVVPYKDHLCEAMERAGVRTHCLSERRSDPLWPLRLIDLVHDGDWDVVHVHSPLPGSVARLAVRTAPSCERPAIITTEHNAWTTFRGPTRLLNRATVGLDAATFAVSEEVRQSMRLPGRVEVLEHGIDVDATAAALRHRQQIRHELGVGSEELVVGTVANFRRQKDYPNLLQAVRQIVNRGVVVRVIAVGQGPDERAVHELTNELGLGDVVTFTGFRDDAVAVLAACDVFVLASQWEGMPVALMEALALSLPVVATEVGGVAEVLTDDVDALLVPPRDADALGAALARALTDRALRTRLAAASAANAGRFDVRRAVERLEQVYVDAAPSDRERDRSAPPPPAKSRTAGPEIRPAEPADREQILALCRASLGWGDDDRYRHLFAWKHDDNVFGPSPMWVAVDAGRIVGLRAFLRWEFRRGGETLRAVRAVDTATHPDHQGRGLFTAMTMHGLDEMHADRVDFVFNTPNGKSRPGYLKMGWEVVGRLPVTLRPVGARSIMEIARSRAASSHWPIPMTCGVSVDDAATRLAAFPAQPADIRALATDRTEAFLRWRYGPDFLGYRVVEAPDCAAVVRLRKRGETRELVVLDTFGNDDAADALTTTVARSEGATHVLRTGAPRMRRGFVTVPRNGPILTWRSVRQRAMPALANWQLTMSDVELF